MKAAILTKNGDPCQPEILSVVEDVPKPTLNDGEILVEVKAAAINPVDWKLMQGAFPGLKEGLVGCDVAGVVQSIGPNCKTSLKVGDEVYADAIKTRGAFAEYCKIEAIAAHKKPTNCTFAEAASLPLVGLTALQGLIKHGGFKAGMSVCILGGSGGVGSLAIQIAKAMAASHVYATGSSVDLLKRLGADTVINYKEQKPDEELAGKDIDILFDTVGGFESWTVAQRCLKKGGVFVTIVGDGGSLIQMVPGILWRMTKSLVGGPKYSLFLTDTSAPAVQEDMKKLTELVESGIVKPLLDDQKFTLTTESLHAMIKASMSHKAKGKLVMTL